MTAEHWSEVRIDYDKPVAEWTLEQCSAYVEGAWEHYGEASAEAGSGAMSLGYGVDGAYAAAGAIPHPHSDPKFVEANARIEAARPAPPPRPTNNDEAVPF